MGPEFKTKVMAVKSEEENKTENVRLNIWDTSGDEMYREGIDKTYIKNS
jgi:hypothetical protein